MFEFQDVTKSFSTDFWKPKVEVLRNLSFQVKEGKCTGFLGANGAGKTTSIKILFKFITHDSGQVLYSSQLGKNWNEIRSNIGFMPERPYFYPELTGNEFLKYMLSISGIKFNSITRKISENAQRLSIDHALDRKLSTYSKGMLQRVGILTTLLHDPKLILLDEPLSGLDPNGRADIKRLLKELNNEGKTIFFSSHIVQDVEEICSELIVIDDGKLDYQGSKDDLIVNRSKRSSFELRTLNPMESDLPDFLVKVDEFNFLFNEENYKDAFLWIQNNQIQIEAMSRSIPTLEEIIYTGKNE
ncbi:MAG: ABC transporter ATP-binding protein [Oligoflexia bacterium]|nr:ABC transporter ATP-binding protein [Oligoflexia bacterium]